MLSLNFYSFTWCMLFLECYFYFACCLIKYLRSEILRWESLHIVIWLFTYSMCFTYIFWVRQYALVLHLYLFRARRWFYFIEIVELSCFTYIILRVSKQHGNCLGFEFSTNIMGIQEGYNKNFHIESIEYYEKFDSLHLFWDIKMVILESC